MTFYGEGGAPDTIEPAPPAGVQCTASAGGNVRVSWQQVTQGHLGGNEPRASRTGCTAATPRGRRRRSAPETPGLRLRPRDPTTGIYFDFPRPDRHPHLLLRGRSRWTGRATRACTRPRSPACRAYAPVAVLACTPSTGAEPARGELQRHLQHRPQRRGGHHRVLLPPGRSRPPTTANPVTYNLTAGGHVVRLTVTDRPGSPDSATANIVVSSTSGNQPPVRRGGARRPAGRCRWRSRSARRARATRTPARRSPTAGTSRTAPPPRPRQTRTTPSPSRAPTAWC